jgi:peptidyl-prolyl cis-trans isomerase A (cyclophilin A)
MRLVLLGGLLWFNGCVRSADAPPPVSPAPPPAEAPGPAPATPPAAGEASQPDPERELVRLLDDPAIPLETRQKILEEMLRSPHQARSEEVDAASTGSAPDPRAQDLDARSPVGKDLRPPVAADLAEYTEDLVGDGPLIATIDTSLGAFHCELFADRAPMTVANFVGLATGKKTWLDPATGAIERGKPFYNGRIFHRVVPGFVIQGGDPLGSGSGGPGYAFDDEVNNGLVMKPGTLAMANAGIRGGHGTNGSQFFITEGSPSWLDNRHTIFGQCKEVDLVQRITRVRTDPRERQRPITPVTIRTITFSRS